MDKVLGIDLGTTNSCMAVLEGGRPVVLENAEGEKTTPSMVAFTTNREILVGSAAKRLERQETDTVIRSIKRFMGRRFDEVREDAADATFNVIQGGNGDALVEVRDDDGWVKQFRPEKIAAKILGKLKADAEAYLGESIGRAVISVPAYFDQSQREATREAGRMAGFDVLRIINEPVAAALGYGLDRKHRETILVYDLGGGTFDVAVLEVGSGEFQVRGYNGDTHLGGDDWDHRLAKWVVADCIEEQSSELDHITRDRIRTEAEKCKIALDEKSTSNLKIPFIKHDSDEHVHVDRMIQRLEFHDICESDVLLGKTGKLALDCLDDVGISKDDVDKSILVGCMTRMPGVADTVEELMGGRPHHHVDPDQVVAMGAAVIGGVHMGYLSDVRLQDVAPLSIGVGTFGGIFTRIIERNTRVPACRSHLFTTARDNQSRLHLKVFQGERIMADDNNLMLEFHISGIPPAPADRPEIEIFFDLDIENMINITARDNATGKYFDIERIADGRIATESEVAIPMIESVDGDVMVDEIERALQDADINEADDRVSLNEAVMRSKAYRLVLEIDKFVQGGIFTEIIPNPEKRYYSVKFMEKADPLENRLVEAIGDARKSLGSRSAVRCRVDREAMNELAMAFEETKQALDELDSDEFLSSIEKMIVDLETLVMEQSS